MLVAVELFTAIVLIIYTIFGLKFGFARGFLRSFSRLFSLIFALICCPFVVSFFESSFNAVEKLSGSLVGVVTRILGSELATVKAKDVILNKTSYNGAGGWVLNGLISASDNRGFTQDLTVSQALSSTLSYYVWCAICWLILYILFRALFFLMAKGIGRVVSLPVISKADGVLGAGLGIIKGMFSVQIVVLIIGLLPFSFAIGLNTAIQNSWLTKLVTTFNPVQLIFDGVINGNLPNVVGKVFF